MGGVSGLRVLAAGVDSVYASPAEGLAVDRLAEGLVYRGQAQDFGQLSGAGWAETAQQQNAFEVGWADAELGGEGLGVEVVLSGSAAQGSEQGVDERRPRRHI